MLLLTLTRATCSIVLLWHWRMRVVRKYAEDPLEQFALINKQPTTVVSQCADIVLLSNNVKTLLAEASALFHASNYRKSERTHTQRYG